ncbi:3,4-dihydroxyphenylacetate 2,3-dioxygenase [Dechloromonas denitrificans]|uniref:3,4-dihydroxyphenylacetate 2,3-dioxygenase n=1 Tax=Dechloromonas denitrificans TaxID=281362 RepID=UPI001CF8B7A0|nr:3,4-dihydroxyphenylacetate 2,3-dioxygenase [Dechloromonas denitrificans]UCV11865.1 3,4-dihydroxyphenylacetate 2,3-dioxygenase [Dechloromonas denitrificans]
MGEILMAIKCTHVPSMLISEQPGPAHGCRQAAIDAEREIGRRAVELGVDTFIVFDTHWLVNAGYHINNNAVHKGNYTSHEFPHFIQDLPYEFPGNPELGNLIAEEATAMGVKTRAHQVASLDLEYGTILPMRYMNPEGKIKVISIAGWSTFGSLEESRILGEALAKAVARSNSKVAIVASGSMSHQIWENRLVEQGFNSISREFNKQVDLRVLQLWENGEWDTFLRMLPEYAQYCTGEGKMHDTAMLFGAIGWDQFAGKAEVVCPYFESSGTGQVVVSLPVAGIPLAARGIGAEMPVS